MYKLRENMGKGANDYEYLNLYKHRTTKELRKILDCHVGNS